MNRKSGKDGFLKKDSRNHQDYEISKQETFQQPRTFEKIVRSSVLTSDGPFNFIVFVRSANAK